MNYHKTIEAYIDANEKWRAELELLRNILNSMEVEEAVKWGAPCYMVNGKNVLGIGAFKSYVAIWFYHGALLADKKQRLINAQEGVTKALRQWRFASIAEIKMREVKSYVKEAISLQTRGLEIKPVLNKPVEIPPELVAALKQNANAHAAFSDMTKGKQREYAEYISQAKRDATKQSRLEKILPMIAESQGLNDKYRNC